MKYSSETKKCVIGECNLILLDVTALLWLKGAKTHGSCTPLWYGHGRRHSLDRESVNSFPSNDFKKETTKLWGSLSYTLDWQLLTRKQRDRSVARRLFKILFLGNRDDLCNFRCFWKDIQFMRIVNKSGNDGGLGRQAVLWDSWGYFIISRCFIAR